METLLTSKPTQEIVLGKRIKVQLPQDNYPFMISPEVEMDALHWAEIHKDQVHDILQEHGAILLRGFNIDNPQKFNKLFTALCGTPLEYKNRTSPRDKVHENVYTSTSHPSDQHIYMHTENSYSEVYNRIIAFYCQVAASEGGETPIADERKLLASLKPETVQKFREKGIRYVRNTIPGIGLNWQTIYQTDDRNEVSEKIKALGYDFTWIDEDHLRVIWNLPAFQNHPITGEEMWFNHMFFGHKSLYDPAILEFFPEENLPFVTYYGDGTEIEDEVIQEFKNFYENNALVFKWQKNDFLLLDNMMYSHGRNPFKGDRTILTAMSQPKKMEL